MCVAYVAQQGTCVPEHGSFLETFQGVVGGHKNYKLES